MTGEAAPAGLPAPQGLAAERPAAAAWLVAARAAADQAPAPTRVPLVLIPDLSAPSVVVGSIEPVVALMLRAAGVGLHPAGAAWLVLGPAALDAAADALIDLGVCGPRRGERLDVAPLDGGAAPGEAAARPEPVASIERAAVRPLGIATTAMHLIGIAADGRVWVQQRALDKATDPGLWDTLMGGQVAAGESLAETLARETMEEAGLALGADFVDVIGAEPVLVRRPVDQGYMVERVEVAVGRLRDGAVPQNRDGEVIGFDCLSVDALEARLAAGAFTLEATLILGAWLERSGAAPPPSTSPPPPPPPPSS